MHPDSSQAKARNNCHASAILARGSACAIVFASYSLRIRFVFSSYSLGVLPSFPYGGQEAIRASPDTCLFVQPLTRFRHLAEPTRRRTCRSRRNPAATERAARSAATRAPTDYSQPTAQTASTALQIPAPPPKSPNPTKCTPHRLAFRRV